MQAIDRAVSKVHGAAESIFAGVHDGIFVLRAASEDAYSWVRYGTIKTVRYTALGELAAAEKIIVLVPDRHDQHDSLHGLASVARATIPAGQRALIVQVGYTDFEGLSAQERSILGLDVSEQFDKLDFVHIGDVTLELMQALRRITGANPQAEIAFLSQGTGATAVSSLSCGPAPIQFMEPVHNKPGPLVKEQVFRHHVFADVRFSDRGHDASAPWNLGSATGSGRMVRPSMSVCIKNVDRTLSVCNAGDAFCDSGRKLDVTRSYFENADLTSAVASFVQDRLFGPRIALGNTSVVVPAVFLEDRPETDKIKFLSSDESVSGPRVRRIDSSGVRTKSSVPSTSAPKKTATKPSYSQTTWVNPQFLPKGSVKGSEAIPSALEISHLPNSSTPISDVITAVISASNSGATSIESPAPLVSAGGSLASPIFVPSTYAFSSALGTGSAPCMTLSG
ncbi:carbohydrate esterase family 5 protein [Ceratocystis lukuohia]|uniref:Carbohydrate esterase family 5 protein n=1 Tax=Ceratocystis lukuohia TaxID=2019550 RepID=A0ABR4MQQ7_9PEZI